MTGTNDLFLSKKSSVQVSPNVQIYHILCHLLLLIFHTLHYQRENFERVSLRIRRMKVKKERESLKGWQASTMPPPSTAQFLGSNCDDHLINFGERGAQEEPDKLVSVQYHYRGEKVQQNYPLKQSATRENNKNFDYANSQTMRTIRKFSAKPMDLAFATTEDVLNCALSTRNASSLRRPPTVQKAEVPSILSCVGEHVVHDCELVPKSSVIKPLAPPLEKRNRHSKVRASRKLVSTSVVSDRCRCWTTSMDSSNFPLDNMKFETIPKKDSMLAKEQISSNVEISAKSLALVSIEGSEKPLSCRSNLSDLRFTSHTF